MFEPSQDMIELEEALDKLLERESRKPYGEGHSFYPYTRSQVIQGVKDKAWNHLEHPLIVETLKKLGFDGFVAQEGPDTNYAFLNPKNLRIVQKIDVGDETDHRATGWCRCPQSSQVVGRVESLIPHRHNGMRTSNPHNWRR